ncbi:Hypothetical predicted protein [Lecanosticta acicola]|uniref:Uncharacterized protein n=1 Tax=Lecanosticta acicola TaxID=111012 RepID=A0AAI8Z0U0_9PEZI|nr:Hypothetical predicted protein [Lecanosticta acicola]
MPPQPEQAEKRLEPVRSATRLQTKRFLRVGETDFEMVHKTQPAPPTAPLNTKPVYDPFEDELNKHPEDHFLSPVQMYEYEDWAEDSDDDAEEVEWDAGITDFALFESDRRRAQERHEDIPGRWDGLLASQASALQRVVERNRADSSPQRRWTPLLEDLPGLTPDSSPDLRGDFDIHAHCAPRQQQRTTPRQTNNSVPNYLTIRVTPPPEDSSDYDSDDFDDDEDSEDDSDIPVSFLVERARERRRQARKLERPGLRYSRTMSGKVHVWRRPSAQIYSVGEDVEAEKRAEMLYCRQHQQHQLEDEQRGRGR